VEGERKAVTGECIDDWVIASLMIDGRLMIGRIDDWRPARARGFGVGWVSSIINPSIINPSIINPSINHQ
jgi:hypothetical protein